MGSPELFTALLSVVLYVTSIQTQDLKDQDVLCNDNSCLVLYLKKKVFLEAWRSCKSQGGNLVTIKGPEEAGMVETLFSKIVLRDGDQVRVWIGLQRQPRKCAAHPMRGFAWITGERETTYTNWRDEDSLATCAALRCVGVSYSTDARELHNNLKWKDGPCSVPLDGYLCRYAFPGMCQPIVSEGDGNTLYNTPFQLITALLTQIPSGSVATVPCVNKGDQTLICMHQEDGSVGWNRDPPYCYDASKTSWCDKDNGGCHHNCIEDGDHFYCDCDEGFLLAEDGLTCFHIDPCQGAPCEFECLAVMQSYRCACPEGSMLAPDERSCVDVDECLQSPCEHICMNTPGSFMCHCHDGYRPEEDGICEDVDECAESPCEHDCENTVGSHICHCDLGYDPLPEDPSRCHDADECQNKGTCEQMCLNFIGSFQCYCEEGYELQIDNSCKAIGENPDSGWNMDWLSNLDMVPTAPPWYIGSQQVDTQSTPLTESSPGIIIVEQEYVTLQTDSTETFLPSTSTPVPDDYEDESTTEPTALPTTTVSEGAEKWLWTSFTPEGLEKGQTSQIPFINIHESNQPDFDDSKELILLDSELQTPTQLILFTPVKEELTTDGINDKKTDGSSWLLVGLLVPFCIFIVVMAVLGIVYCTRCSAKPQNKKATDCYHWIAGAGDKAAADMAGGKV